MVTIKKTLFGVVSLIVLITLEWNLALAFTEKSVAPSRQGSAPNSNVTLDGRSDPESIPDSYGWSAVFRKIIDLKRIDDSHPEVPPQHRIWLARTLFGAGDIGVAGLSLESQIIDAVVMVVEESVELSKQFADSSQQIRAKFRSQFRDLREKKGIELRDEEIGISAAVFDEMLILASVTRLEAILQRVFGAVGVKSAHALRQYVISAKRGMTITDMPRTVLGELLELNRMFVPNELSERLLLRRETGVGQKKR